MKLTSNIYDNFMSVFKKHVANVSDEPELPKCVRCGYCCMQAPCEFGIWNSETERCEFLVWDDEADCYACGIIDEIKELPRAILSPAFGAGCSSSIGNEQREKFL